MELMSSYIRDRDLFFALCFPSRSGDVERAVFLSLEGLLLANRTGKIRGPWRRILLS